MKISCQQENLSKGLSIVGNIASRNANHPILSDILIKVEDGKTILTTTNLEILIDVSLKSDVEENGEFCIDAKLLNEYISLLPQGNINLLLDGDNLKVTSGKQKTKIKGHQPGEYPIIPKIEKKNPYIISIDELDNALSKVIFAASTSEIKPEISGVYCKFNKNNITLVATDGYRLEEKKIELSNNKNDKEQNAIVPVKTLNELSRILAIFKDDVDPNKNIEIYLDEGKIMFSYDNIDIVSRLIEGQYPDYSQIIPKSIEIKARVDNKELLNKVRIASLFTKNGINDVKLEFRDGELTVSSFAENGENTGSIDIDIQGNDCDIIMNYRYLLNGLQNMITDNIVFGLNDGNTPCIIKEEGSKDYIYVIMPIRQ